MKMIFSYKCIFCATVLLIAFSVHACRIVLTLAQKYSLAESARMYSSEIEYSTENCGALMALDFEK